MEQNIGGLSWEILRKWGLNEPLLGMFDSLG